MKKMTKALKVMMLMAVVLLAAGCNKPDNPDNGGNDNGGDNGGGEVTDLHAYVDLGLPSGTLWATCNVGADTPEGYGEYFAWGETEPKGIYKWDNYKYGEYHYFGIYTKYYDGDGILVLEAMDDAATVNWGDEWRTPTPVEFKELIENTTSELTTQNEVKGRLFTAANGKSLFLPASGKHENEDALYVGASGYYWSNTRTAPVATSAYNLDFHSGVFQVSNTHREYGLTVRPVRSGK